MPTETTVVSKAAIEYFEALVSNGLFVIDASGAGSITPAVDALVDAIHEVLAGGRVSIKVDATGNPTIKAGLEARLDAAVESLNSQDPSGAIVFTP